MLLLKRGYLNQQPQHRLAFRELGLAIGLRALPIIADAVDKNGHKFDSRPELHQTIDLLLSYESLSDEIIGLWLRHAELQHESWKAHQDINEVMLATAIIPDTFLSVGEQRLWRKSFMHQARRRLCRRPVDRRARLVRTRSMDMGGLGVSHPTPVR
jgi:hypothetical protein